MVKYILLLKNLVLLEQISTLMFSLVERVLITLPHAQVIVVST